jgi:hypothetical protein
MSWTINGSSPETLKLVVCKVDVGTGMIDTAVLETANDWDTSVLSYGDWVTIASGGVALLWGMVTEAYPYAVGGGRQGRRYVVSGPQWHLERTPYTQPFHYATTAEEGEALPRSRCWIGVDPTTGDRCHTREALSLVLQAAVDAGVPMTFALDAGDLGSVLAPPFEVTDATCGSVVQQILRWHPGCYTFWRYSAGSAQLKIAQDDGGSSFDVTDGGSAVPLSVSVTPREDMVPAGIIIRWERVNVFEMTGESSDSLQRIESITESAGVGEPGVGVLMYTIELKGSETQYAEQAIVARTVPDDVAPEDGGEDLDESEKERVLKWYGNHLSWVKALPAAALQVNEHTRVMDLPEWDSDDDQKPADWNPADGLPIYDESIDPGDLSRELVDGEVPEWAKWIKAEPMLARVKIKWTGGGSPTTEEIDLAKSIFGEGLDQVRTFDVQYTGTNARSKRYKGLVKFIAAEPWPTAGLAAQVLSALSSLRYEGEITAGGNAPYTGIKAGKVIILSGGRTGSGVCQRVSWEAATNRTTIQFGFAGHLQVPDYIELQRASRQNAMTANYAKERQQAASPSAKSSIMGSKRTKRTNTSSPDGGGGASCPFSGGMVDGDFAFSTPGTLNALDPDNMFDGSELCTVGMDGQGYVVLNVTTIDNNVQSGHLEYSADPPPPIPTGEGVAPGEFKIALYYVNLDGRPYRLIGCGSLWATAVEVFRTSNPTPDACGDPHIRHYTWSIATV